MKRAFLSFLLVSIICLGGFTDVKAQGTFDFIVDSIFSVSCWGSGCHQAGEANPLILVDTPRNIIYDILLHQQVTNPWARDNSGNKLVDPGNTNNSYLLRKLSCGLGPEPALLQPQEGTCMPGQIDPSLPGFEDMLLDSMYIAVVRTWIAGGAPDTGVVTGIDMIKVGLENSFEVFPNPFNGSINISYTLPRTMHVRMELLNILGERKTLFVDEKQAAGNHSLKFDTRLNALPESVYILNIYLDDYFISRKVVQVK